MGNCCFCFLAGWRQLSGYQRIPESSVTHHASIAKLSATAATASTAATTTANSTMQYRSSPKKTLRGKNQTTSEPVLEEELRNSRGRTLGFPVEFAKLYEVGSVVGVGTTSKVYAVYHRKRRRIDSNNSGSGGRLACKVIDKRKLTLGMDEEDITPLLQQLRKEVDILKRIDHPNIVGFHDFMETDSKLFIITEYLSGGELFDHIINHGPLEETAARRVLYGVFSAVAYLHDRGVIHRDIKAENLIFFHSISEHRSEVSLKIIDFGFSTILKHDLTGSFMGTGGYIAPEIRQNKRYSMSVDSWSLGVLLYCTLSAKLPFEVSVALLPHTVEQCRDAFVLKFPQQKWAHVSDQCKHLVTRLLEIDPMKRFTAKDALLHPWFREEHLKALQSERLRSKMAGFIGPPLRPRADSYHGDISSMLHQHQQATHTSYTSTTTAVATTTATTTTDRAAAGVKPSIKAAGTATFRRGRVAELPSLSSALRPSQSTAQLEKRFSGSTNSTITTSRKDSESIAQCGDVVGGVFIDDDHDDDDNDHTASGVPSYEIKQSSVCSRSNSQIGSNNKKDQTLGSDSKYAVMSANDATVKATTTTAGVDTMSRSNTSYSNLAADSYGIAIPTIESAATTTATKAGDQQTTNQPQSWGRSSSFIWEEMHDRLAGDLFYTTYQRSRKRK